MDEQTKNDIIEKAKEAISEETGITPERFDEIKAISQNIMNDIKDRLKDVDSAFERGYILNVVSEKCGYVSRLHIIEAMGYNANNEEPEA